MGRAGKVTANICRNESRARGVDGESWKSYGKHLSERITALHNRIHTQGYKPKPVLRIWLPKPDGNRRPVGITSVEDKIVQQALVWVLETIYEADFLGFSYGFRPNRNQHQALNVAYVAITQKKVSWILDADIRKFFDQIDHDWMMKFLQHRIADKRLLQLIKQTLKAGVVEDSRYSKTVVGTPQFKWGSYFTITGEYLPPLCFRFMGTPMAEKKRQRGVLYCPLCGR